MGFAIAQATRQHKPSCTCVGFVWPRWARQGGGERCISQAGRYMYWVSMTLPLSLHSFDPSIMKHVPTPLRLPPSVPWHRKWRLWRKQWNDLPSPTHSAPHSATRWMNYARPYGGISSSPGWSMSTLYPRPTRQVSLTHSIALDMVEAPRRPPSNPHRSNLPLQARAYAGS